MVHAQVGGELHCHSFHVVLRGRAARSQVHAADVAGLSFPLHRDIRADYVGNFNIAVFAHGIVSGGASEHSVLVLHPSLHGHHRAGACLAADGVIYHNIRALSGTEVLYLCIVDRETAVAGQFVGAGIAPQGIVASRQRHAYGGVLRQGARRAHVHRFCDGLYRFCRGFGATVEGAVLEVVTRDETVELELQIGNVAEFR